jgi:hypothetical protein
LEETTLLVPFGDSWGTFQPFYQYYVWHSPLSEAQHLLQILGTVPFVPPIFFLSPYYFPIVCPMMITTLSPSHQDIFLIPVLPFLCPIHTLVSFPPFLNILFLSLIYTSYCHSSL